MCLKERKISAWEEKQQKRSKKSFDDALESLGVRKRFMENKEEDKSLENTTELKDER